MSDSSPESDGGATAAPATLAVDPAELMRSKQYRGLLVVSGLLGVVVSVASWLFLEVTHWLQQSVYVDLPDSLGYDTPPWWWPLPPLAVAGLAVAIAVARLPGRGGHEPSEGLKPGGTTSPIQVPGVVLAALASIGLGLVLGPEAPLIALGSGLTVYLVGLSRRDVPDQARLVLAAAASFAALATIFGSPVIGAVIIIEAAGLGGPMLPVILLPGLLASGIGSLVFVGIGSLTGLSTDAYALPPLSLAPYPEPTVAAFLWTILLALVAAVVVFVVVELAKTTQQLVAPRPFLMYPAAALAVGLVAIAFAEISDQTANVVLFSGQEAMSDVVKDASTISLGTLAFLIACKAVAWAISMGAARGGPTFPAIFLGLTGGLLAAHLPGFDQTPAIGVLIGAAVVAVLRLPLSAIVIALLITQAGQGVAPLVIVAVVVAYIAVLLLDARRNAVAPVAQPAG